MMASLWVGLRHIFVRVLCKGSPKLVGLIASYLRNSKAVTGRAETHKRQISEVRYGKLLLLLRKWKEYCVSKATWNLIQTLVSSAKTP